MTLDQFLNGKIAPDEIVACRFVYNNKPRVVDNATFEKMTNTIIGFEMREQGRFSYNVKRFSLDKIDGDIEFIDPPTRSGPAIGRP
jgi:hypothetical protein